MLSIHTGGVGHAQPPLLACFYIIPFSCLTAAAPALQVKAHGGVLGAAVCCAENGGDPEDEWTTCERDRDLLLDRFAVPLTRSVRLRVSAEAHLRTFQTLLSVRRMGQPEASLAMPLRALPAVGCSHWRGSATSTWTSTWTRTAMHGLAACATLP